MYIHFSKKTSGNLIVVRLLARVCVILFAFLVGSPQLHAQFRTSIQGVVTDPDGEVVPGATLTLKNLSTNETVVRTSNETGVFNFNALPAGPLFLDCRDERFPEEGSRQPAVDP